MQFATERSVFGEARASPPSPPQLALCVRSTNPRPTDSENRRPYPPTQTRQAADSHRALGSVQVARFVPTVLLIALFYFLSRGVGMGGLGGGGGNIFSMVSARAHARGATPPQ